RRARAQSGGGNRAGGCQRRARPRSGVAAGARDRLRECDGRAGIDRERNTRMSHKVAVVEDNPDNRMLVQAILEDRYEISEYESVVAAIEGLEADRPDIILLGISLPEMDGTDVLAWIRGQETLQAIPVIALTAHAMAGDREKYLAAG